ncbi:TRAP transporter small permease [Moraxella bovoculi]|uniref:TRAP transporter small permease n=1 Tax=Moraxella bovoculi TaxID=386891 RepID=UPI003F50C779
MADSFELEIKDDRPADALGRFLWGWSKLSAFGGVAILVGICLLSTASVVGRAVFNTPIKGDVELVQIGCALAIASFLPYAQMKKAHVIVDFFTIKAPIVVRKYLDIFAAVLLGMVALVLMWRSYFGAVNAFKNGTKTMILGLPEWWAHITIAPGFFLLALTAFYTAWRFFKRYEAK